MNAVIAGKAKSIGGPMQFPTPRLATGTGGSIPVVSCQLCGVSKLHSVIFLGYLPPVNTMPPIGTPPVEQPGYPAQILRCDQCNLFQLGLVVDPSLLFPPHYAYTSGTTQQLKDNFQQLSHEVSEHYPLKAKDLVVDVGSNDGTLLTYFKDQAVVQGIEPTNAGKLAIDRGIPTLTSFFNKDAVQSVLRSKGQARLLTITNCFAHMENIHGVMESVLALLSNDGIFVTESHYLVSLLETVQYDTIYHEHLRYYSLTSLRALLEMHGLEIVRAKRIPTHGGSIRVYAAHRGKYQVSESVSALTAAEEGVFTTKHIEKFRHHVVASKLGLHAILKNIRERGERVFGIGAPSRACTLIHYVGLDEGILDCVLEIKGSYKIGKYIPGTLIPVLDESVLCTEQPEYALLFSWHIAEELIPKLKSRGFRGKFIIPLPTPRIVSAKESSLHQAA